MTKNQLTVEQIADKLIGYLDMTDTSDAVPKALDYYCVGLATSPSRATILSAIRLAVERLRDLGKAKHADALAAYGSALRRVEIYDRARAEWRFR